MIWLKKVHSLNDDFTQELDFIHSPEWEWQVVNENILFIELEWIVMNENSSLNHDLTNELDIFHS